MSDEGVPMGILLEVMSTNPLVVREPPMFAPVEEIGAQCLWTAGYEGSPEIREAEDRTFDDWVVDDPVAEVLPLQVNITVTAEWSSPEGSDGAPTPTLFDRLLDED